MVAIGNEAEAATVRAALAPLGITVLAGAAGVEEAASHEADITVAAIVGAAGLAPTMAAVRRGATVVIADIEAHGGELVLGEPVTGPPAGVGGSASGSGMVLAGRPGPTP